MRRPDILIKDNSLILRGYLYDFEMDGETIKDWFVSSEEKPGDHAINIRPLYELTGSESHG